MKVFMNGIVVIIEMATDAIIVILEAMRDVILHSYYQNLVDRS